MICKNKEPLGRISYDRSFLIALRSSPLSLVKPVSCEEHDIILNEPLTPESSSTQEITADFFSHLQSNNKANNHKHIITGITLNNDQKLLHVSEKPWKPGHKDSQKDEKNKSLESAVLYIMNRLTPSNFKKLAEEMMALEIKSYEDLELVVNTVFDKVALETKFVHAYASLCQVMLGLQVEPPPTLARNKATFRAVLVTKCQKAFEADKSVIFEDAEETKRKIMEEMTEDTPSRAEKIESALYQIKLNQLKFFGNISFIGELFKLGILPEVIIHSCITRLLSAADEESLFSLCKLITTVGKHIDTAKAKVQIDKYFVRISQLANASKSRLKFTLKDVLDLRKNNWVPRTETAGPKTIAELHKEFKEEQTTTESPKAKPKKSAKTEVREAPLSQNNRLSNATVRKEIIPTNIGKEKESVKGVNDSDKENDDSWTQVTSKGKAANSRNKKNKAKNAKQAGTEVKDKKEHESDVNDKRDCTTRDASSEGSFDVIPKLYNEEFTFKKIVKEKPTEDSYCPSRCEEQIVETIDFNRFKLSKKSNDDIVLAPGGRTMFGSFLGKLCRDKSKASSNTSDQSATQNKNTNRFSLLLNESTEECLDEKPPKLDSSILAKQQQPITLDACQLGNHGKKEPAPATSESHKPCLQEEARPTNQMTEDELQVQTQNIIDEYISCKDKKEVLLCVMELKSKADLSSLVTMTINHVLEKTDTIRELIGELFNELTQANILTADNIIKGFSEVLIAAGDIVIDVPKLWAYLAQLIAPMLGHSLPWLSIEPLICPYMSPDSCALMLAHILRLFQEKQISMTDIQNNWTTSGLKWTQFLQQDEVAHFLETHGIYEIFTSSADLEKPVDTLRETEAEVVLELENTAVIELVDKAALELADTAVLELADRAVLELADRAVLELADKAVLELEDKAVLELEDKAVFELEDKAVLELEDKAVLELEDKAVLELEKAVLELEDKAVLELEDMACLELADKPVRELKQIEDHSEIIQPVNVNSCSNAILLINANEEVLESPCLQPDDQVTDVIEKHVHTGEGLIINQSLDTNVFDDRQNHENQEAVFSISSDENGEAIWRREMEEDEAGFSVSFMPVGSGASQVLVCKVPFLLEIEEENEETIAECSSHAGVHHSGSQSNNGGKITLAAKELLNNCCPIEVKDASPNDAQNNATNKESFPNLQDEGYYETSSNEGSSEDNIQVPWSTVYLDGSSKQYLECIEEEEISFASRHDNYFWGSKLYTHEDHQRYLGQLQLQRSRSVLSADAPSFHPFRQSVPFSETFSGQSSFLNIHHSEDVSDSFYVCQVGGFSVNHEVNVENKSFSLKQATEETDQDCFLQPSHNAFSVSDEHFKDYSIATKNSTGADSSVPDFLGGVAGRSNPLSLFLSESQTGTSQSNSDLINFLVMCQQAASVMETMLRNKSTNKEILQFIQTGIIGTAIDRALLPIFMTALAYSSLNDVDVKIVTERKEIISYLLRNDQFREIEAVQILYIVLCHLSCPQGISALLDELFNEQLVSLSSLQTLFRFIQNARTTSDKSSHGQVGVEGRT